jgi:hypothetical protein
MLKQSHMAKLKGYLDTDADHRLQVVLEDTAVDRAEIVDTGNGDLCRKR